jgi:hypothetical protein
MTKIVFFLKKASLLFSLFSLLQHNGRVFFFLLELNYKSATIRWATAGFLCGHLPDSCQRNRVAGFGCLLAMAVTNVFQFKQQTRSRGARVCNTSSMRRVGTGMMEEGGKG